jgi:hypothetical protein
MFGVFDDFFSSVFASAPKHAWEPPKHRCDVCNRMMSPVAAGVSQFGYYEVSRKYGIPSNMKRVCCDLCARDYENKFLPGRYPTLDGGDVYLMRGTHGYKIGKTEVLETRKKQIERRHQQTLELVHTIKAPHAVC